VVSKGAKVKVLRRNRVVYEGTVATLKHEKKNVAQMRKDTECGMAFDDWGEFEVGDRVQCIEESREQRKLDVGDASKQYGT